MPQRRSGTSKKWALRFGSGTLLAAGGLALVVALVAAGTFTALPRNPLPEPPAGAGKTAIVWPPFVAAAPAEAREAYRFALENPGALEFIPCYCGCKAAGHKNNEACFIASRNGGQVVFDRHGAG